MNNMFSENQNKKIPNSIDECLKPDSVSSNLWILCQRLENLGKILFWIIIVFGVIFSVVSSFREVDVEGILYDYTDTEFDFEMLCELLVQTAVYAFIEYCAYHVLALLIGALGSIVQNMRINADLALYKIANDTNYCVPESSNSKSANETTQNEEKLGDCEVIGSTLSKGTCEFCNKKDVKIINCKIKDSMGTRYINLCVDCIEKYNTRY